MSFILTYLLYAYLVFGLYALTFWFLSKKSFLAKYIGGLVLFLAMFATIDLRDEIMYIYAVVTYVPEIHT